MMDTLDRALEKISFCEDKVKTDSREIEAGDIFMAVKGTVYDGHDYIRQAVAKGAGHVVCEHEPSGLSEEEREKCLVVADTTEELGRIARRIFHDPSESLEVFGITGTNGKTTTVFLIDSILNTAGKNSGFISTVCTKTSGDVCFPSSMTTPGVMSVNRLLSEMRSSGKDAAVIEISSHALAQKRIWGVGLDAAVFTNITPEHLDYHKNMARYLKDKSEIFSNLKPGSPAALNADDPVVIGLKKNMDLLNTITFGFAGDADVRAENIQLSSGGTSFDLSAGRLGRARINTRFIGRHNVYNMLAAVSALLNSGLDIDHFKKGLEASLPVPGRLDQVISDAPFRIFVDYAHTPDAMKNILQCLRSLTPGRLICVFGCGGNRDKSKRPVMGRIASGICDTVILTNDNPRLEDPEEILRQIENGVIDGSNYCIMGDRRDAIRKSIETAGSQDVIVIAGKGHEDCQMTAGQVIHFNDKETACEILKKLGYKNKGS